jgi:hypothetical protein
MSPKVTDRVHAQRPFTSITYCGRRIVPTHPRHQEVRSRSVSAVPDQITCKACLTNSAVGPRAVESET